MSQHLGSSSTSTHLHRTYESSSWSTFSDDSQLKATSSSESSGSFASRPRQRPSHRPRGCRGGKRNKKKLQQQQQQQLSEQSQHLQEQHPTLCTEPSEKPSETRLTCNTYASMANLQSEATLGYPTATINSDKPATILPPPMTITSETFRTPWQGLNPYALSLSHQAVSIFTDNADNIDNNDDDDDDDDYTHLANRIEKQRQMLVDGGSLFVVSPRSFLLNGAPRNQQSWWRE
ncbi:hypothetical protein MPSEU_000080100 [Mayamaea pseudoterrestris]|nr:hypothetical protein MPSEU_000080100 [Mayamaea pseudoterrestris]